MNLDRALVLLDLTGGPPTPELRELWEQTRFLERLCSLGGTLRSLGGPAVDGPKALEDREALDRLLDDLGLEAIVRVDPDQLFLDPQVARAGLAHFDPSTTDTFTQWEHCRIPVGVGVRALSTRTWRELDVSSPAEAWDRVRATAQGRRFAYDPRALVSYEESLLDARVSPRLLELAGEHPDATFDLPGFLRLASPNDSALRFAADRDAPRVDERGMAAPYGFESLSCARFPTYVMFDITNLCNARCVHCPQSLRDENGAVPDFLAHKGHQDFEVFRRVIDECAEHEVHFLRITADGEPLVHPQLFEMLEYARDRGVGPVGLTTNGSLLNESRARRLLTSGVAMVDFSLDASTKETFERVRVGLSYERTLANVHRFLELRRETDAPVRVLVSFVRQASNDHELDRFRAQWDGLVDEVLVREMTSNVGLNEVRAADTATWGERWPCAHYFRRVVVNHTGLLKTCPIDWKQRTTLEPVLARSIHAQWHSKTYWRQRMAHLNDAFPADSACAGCGDWRQTPWELGYEKVVERLVPVTSGA